MRTEDPEQFAALLTQALEVIRKKEDKSIGYLQDELGFALGRSGGSVVHRWRKGYLPPDEGVTRKITVFFREEYPNALDKEWYRDFLKSAGYYHVDALITELFPDSVVASFKSSEPAFPEIPIKLSIDKASLIQKDQSPGFIEQFTLPFAEIPPLRKLPENSRAIPFPYHRSFVDRKKTLQKLAKLLIKEKVAVVSGLGGVGKTHLVLEFAHRYGAYFTGGVFWLSFAQPENIPIEMGACGDALGLNSLLELKELNQAEQMAVVFNAWQQPIPRLLIFDSCEDSALLRKWRPKYGGCYILVTSRKDRWPRAMSLGRLPLGPLTKHQSITFFQKYCPSISATEAANIAEALGNLPLALHCAGSFLESHENVLSSTYLQQLHEMGLEHPSLTNYGSDYSPTDHTTHIRDTFELSYQYLDPKNDRDAIALAFLARAAHFAPGEPIPQDMLIDTLEKDDESIKGAFSIGEGLSRLRDLGFISYTSRYTIQLHQLIAQFLKWRTQNNDIAQQAVEMLVLQNARKLNALENPAGFKGWEVHFHHIVKSAKNREDRVSAELSYELGTYLRVIGEYGKAHNYLEHTWHIRHTLLGENHPDTISSLNDIGVVLGEMGRLEDAQKITQETIVLWQKVTSKQIGMAESYNNMGWILVNLSKFETAIDYYRVALDICEELSPPERILQGKILNNIGHALQLLGRHNESVVYYEKTWSLWDENLEKNHPYLGITWNNLGTAYFCLNNFSRAKENFDNALEVYNKVLGPKHPRTIITHNNLGGVLHELGDYRGSKRHLTTAWNAYMELLPEDINRVFVLRHLGLLSQKQHEVKQAQEYFQQALTILEAWEKEEERDHPLTRIVSNHLATLPK